jgi:Outer membrane protein beta-barrel domain
MNRKLIVLPALLILSTGIYAQGLKLGVKAGASMNKITGKTFKEQFTFGYQIGGFAEIKLSNKLGVQPELLFGQVNLDTSSSFSSIYEFNNVSNIQLKYISIPILLNYKLTPGITLQAGPQFGIVSDRNKTLLKNGAEAFRNGDFSMLGGVQIKLMNFRIYGRYAIGLSNLDNIGDKDKWKSQSIQFGVGFTL